jgi:hypothetical protein
MYIPRHLPPDLQYPDTEEPVLALAFSIPATSSHTSFTSLSLTAQYFSYHINLMRPRGELCHRQAIERGVEYTDNETDSTRQ